MSLYFSSLYFVPSGFPPDRLCRHHFDRSVVHLVVPSDTIVVFSQRRFYNYHVRLQFFSRRWSLGVFTLFFPLPSFPSKTLPMILPGQRSVSRRTIFATNKSSRISVVVSISSQSTFWRTFTWKKTFPVGLRNAEFTAVAGIGGGSVVCCLLWRFSIRIQESWRRSSSTLAISIRVVRSNGTAHVPPSSSTRPDSRHGSGM